jgi:hypothetical protein
MTNSPYSGIGSDITPFINQSDVAEYKLCHKKIYDDLIAIQQAIFFLERIVETPFGLLFPTVRDEYTFWWLQRNYLIETIVIMLYRVFCDTDGESISIRRLKNLIFQTLTDKNVKQLLAGKCAAANFDSSLDNLRDRIRFVRNKYYGHLDYQEHLSPSQIGVSIKDFKDLLNSGSALFDALTISTTHSLWLSDHPDSQRQRYATGIDNLLKATVQNSFVLQPPKPQQIHVDRYRGLTQEARDTLNVYFKRVGIEHVIPDKGNGEMET